MRLLNVRPTLDNGSVLKHPDILLVLLGRAQNLVHNLAVIS